MSRVIGVIVALVVIVSSATVLFAQPATKTPPTGPVLAAPFNVTETYLNDIPDQILTLMTTPDGCHIGYIAMKDGRQVLLIDGKVQSTVGTLTEGPLLTPDGKHWAAATRVTPAGGGAEQDAIIVDGNVLSAYDGYSRGTLSVSLAGDHISYVAQKGKAVVVIDGKIDSEPGFTTILVSPPWISFSQDGRHHAYRAGVGMKRVAVIDGVTGPEVDDLTTPSFNSDASHCFYIIKKNGKQSLVTDGKPGPEFDNILDVRYSPDGKKIAYVGSADKKVSVMLDGQVVGTWDAYGTDSLVFSADSAHMAYTIGVTTATGIKTAVVVDGKQGQQFDGIADKTLVLTPDGKHVAYAASVNKAVVVILDGKLSIPYENVMPNCFAFSPDGSRLAYGVVVDGKQRLVVDGAPGPAFDLIADSQFSPDSRRIAYVGLVKTAVASSAMIVVDGRQSPVYDGIIGRSLRFSADSKHVAYVAGRAGKQFLVYDDTPGSPYDTIMIGGPRLDKDGTIEYLAVKDKKLYRVQYQTAGN